MPIQIRAVSHRLFAGVAVPSPLGIIISISVLVTGLLFQVSAYGAGVLTNSSIKGSVKDSQTGDALPGATILLKGTSLGSSSDLAGDFIIRNVPPGSYTLRATYVGYRSVEVPITVNEGQDLTENLKLEAVAIQGQSVLVTAQASGQNAAINQQLSSMQITNVVSAAKIQELPDANAAESVGRLPGVSLIREGGEASQVVIRGLAPQYNQITIDGVQMGGNVTPNTSYNLLPDTRSPGINDQTALANLSNFGDRSVDLSMVSSNSLGGIEVTKAITPDMDAAVLGGVVNFDLREAQTGVSAFHLLAQGGYNNLKDDYGDYRLGTSGEKRFFDERLGVYADVEVERRNLSANQLGADYNIKTKNFGVTNRTYLYDVTLTDIPRERQRYDGTITMDYKLNDGKIDLMTFYSYGDTKEQDRAETFKLLDQGNSHVYSLTDQETQLTQLTNILDFKKEISSFDIDAKVSHSYSENYLPYNNDYQFQQLSAGYSNVNDENLSPQQIPALANDSLPITQMFSVADANSMTKQRNISASLDLKTNLDFSNWLTSTIKFGGQFQYVTRSYNYEQSDGNIWYSGGNVIQGIENTFPWMIPTIQKYGMIIPLVTDSGYSYKHFFDGSYNMGPAMNVGLLNQMLQVAKKYGTLESWSYNAVASGTSDYSGKEYRSAGYGMATVNFGPDLTLLPGIRYQVLETDYTAPRALSQLGPISRYTYIHKDTTVDVAHGFWLPMVHLRYNPLSWMQIHLAYTNSITYPDVSAITPELQVGTSSVDYHNYLLKPAHSSNYDAILSIYDNTIGLLSIDGFYKHINDLIFSTGTTYVLNASQFPGVPTYALGYSINTSVNDPYAVEVYGAEVDWETHFWYLPGPLSGLVLSANYSRIFSQAKYPYTYIHVISQYPFKADTISTYFTDRLINQPSFVANLAIGYDYRDFSARVSMLYQSNVFEAYNFWPELRSNTDKYLRWDASVKQGLPWLGVQVFFDLYNINGARDITLNNGSNFPSAEDHYGMTADLGIRLQL
ncbi:MAG TPA: TonB-dependent receptor [Candidatus Kryptonia bacterium]